MNEFTLAQRLRESISAELQNLLPSQLEQLSQQVEQLSAIALQASGKCRSCGAEIFWDIIPGGKRCPFNRDTGESHFKTCPDAHQWGKKSSRLKSERSLSQPPSAAVFAEQLGDGL